MKTENYFSASADITRRAGVISSCYRTKEGRFIITNNDLTRIRLVMTPEEYINGIDVVSITADEAKRLISENGYKIGEEYVEEVEETIENEQGDTEVSEEPAEEVEETLVEDEQEETNNETTEEEQ